MTMRTLSLFSGIGAHDLGLQMAGMTIAGQVEIDPYCSAVLDKHWPDVPRWADVRTVTGELVRERCGHIRLVTGGFPCQDISVAGKGAGLKGTRSGLFFELARIIGEVGPDWVLLENVPALKTRGYDRVVAELEGLGYACWPTVAGADSCGAPHKRHRAWIVGRRMAQPNESAVGGRRVPVLLHDEGWATAAAWQAGLQQGWEAGDRGPGAPGVDGGGPELDLATEPRRAGDTGRSEAWAVRHEAWWAELARPCGGVDLPNLPGCGVAGEGDAGRGESEQGPADHPAAGGAGELAHPAQRGQRADARGGDGHAQGAAGLADSLGAGLAQRVVQSEVPGRAERADEGQDAAVDCFQQRWPARPGEQQHDWEAPRIVRVSKSSVGHAVAGASRRVVGSTGIDHPLTPREQSWERRQALKALGNANPYVIPMLMGMWILKYEERA